jgi:hypothetical protein
VAQFGTQLNDQISSILNESEFDVYFYTDEKFRGAGIEIPSHTFVPNLNPDGVNDGANDKISSWVPHLGQ